MRERDIAAQAAEYFLGQQPRLIRDRIQSSASFGENLGLRAEPAILIGNRVTVSRDKLFSAVRRLLADNPEKGPIAVAEGLQIDKRTGGGLVLQLRRSNGELEERSFDKYLLFSTSSSARVRAIETVMAEVGPASPDFSSYISLAAQRELTDDEIAEILTVKSSGVVATQAELGDRLAKGIAVVHDLVPTNIDYFERFCGPDPGDLPPEVYLTSVLPDYRRELMCRDLRQGLDICLLGSLRDDLSPGRWLQDVGDEDLWSALKSCPSDADPFSLLASLDIAIYRQHDKRFREFAQATVETLTREELPRKDGVDLYRLLPVLASFILNQVNLLENGTMRAPFWKRMCAWMQAGVASRLVRCLELEFEALEESISSNLTGEGDFANTLDFRREPMAAASQMEQVALRREVIGRLTILEQRHEKEGRTMPGIENLLRAKGGAAEGGPSMSWLLPGPLEGHYRPADQERSLPAEALAEFSDAPKLELIHRLAFVCQFFDLGEETRYLLRSTIEALFLGGDEVALNTRFAGLLDAAAVAAAERDEKLARVIADALFVAAPKIGDGEVRTCLNILFIAGAAFEEERTWAKWLEKRLFDLAWRLPSGEVSVALHYQLQQLKRVTKLELGLHRRAEAVASAAAT